MPERVYAADQEDKERQDRIKEVTMETRTMWEIYARDHGDTEYAKRNASKGMGDNDIEGKD
jgi:hypothetical protein